LNSRAKVIHDTSSIILGTLSNVIYYKPILYVLYTRLKLELSLIVLYIKYVKKNYIYKNYTYTS